MVGMDLGTLLCQAGEKEGGMKILNRSKEGFNKLGRGAMAQQVERIMRNFE